MTRKGRKKKMYEKHYGKPYKEKGTREQDPASGEVNRGKEMDQDDTKSEHGPTICRLIGEPWYQVDYEVSCVACRFSRCPIVALRRRIEKLEEQLR